MAPQGESRIGVYPGSFNPLTTAHIAIVGAARLAHRLDRVDLVVSRSALAKQHVDHPRFHHRIDVLHRAVVDVPWLVVQVTEQQLLADIADGYHLLIVGADKWWQIQDPVWYGGDHGARDSAIAALPPVAIVPRHGLETPAERTLGMDPELIGDVSSTAARGGRKELMVPAAREFAERTGAWIDPDRYERWARAQAEPDDRP